MTSYIDLHRHLDGSLRLDTLYTLARAQNITLPDPAEILFFKGMGLRDALERFAYTLSVLQHPDSVKRVASEMCVDAFNNRVSHLEIRFAPQLHTRGTLEKIVEAALDGISGRAGLILCGLYGESPEVLHRLLDIAIKYDGVCGIDLAGGPIPTHRYTMRDYASVFLRARKHHIGRTVHAGEGRPPQEIACAITDLHAQRIGHGTTLLEDKEVIQLIKHHRVCIEACVTSNVHTGVIATPEEHPIAQWIDLGIPVAICTDNTLLSAVNSPQEYQRVRSMTSIDDAHLRFIEEQVPLHTFF